MAHSIDDKPVNMRGGYWMQEARETTVKYLEGHVLSALKKYAEKNEGKLPLSIVVFRGGVSEGEYSKVCHKPRKIENSLIFYPFFQILGGHRRSQRLQRCL